MINIIILLAEKHFKCDRVKVIVWTRISILKMKTHYHASAFNGICPLGTFLFCTGDYHKSCLCKTLTTTVILAVKRKADILVCESCNHIV